MPPTDRLDIYDALFAVNQDSVQHKLTTALFGLTTLVQDGNTRLAVVAELRDALAILATVRAMLEGGTHDRT